MHSFREIIGQESIKKELMRTADVLRNTEAYTRLGAKPPFGLLLHGKPGVGKSLMATCLIDESGRRTFTCRKDRPTGEFVNAIREIFAQAKEHSPSIVFLDDLDKFANGDERHRDAEEYIAVQSGIDDTRDYDVFVLATVDDINRLPPSLTRPGRFDRIIEVFPPQGEEAVQVVAHYLSTMPFVSGIDASRVADLMVDATCAELTSAINKAGLLAGSERASEISMRHILLGFMEIVYRVSSDHILAGKTNDDAFNRAVVHEAGHIAAAELLFPGSVTISCIFRDDDGFTRGITSHRKFMADFAGEMSSIVCALAGRAFVEITSSIPDTGASADIEIARSTAKLLVNKEAVFGLEFIGHMSTTMSNTKRAHIEEIIDQTLDRCYTCAKHILIAHRPFVEAISTDLAEKGLILSDDIREIREKLYGNKVFSIPKSALELFLSITQ